MTAAFENFSKNINQSVEAIEVYKFLKSNGYSADFGLRFVWVSALSALDHYMTELIVEKATQHFAAGTDLSAKLLSEGVPISQMLKLSGSSPAAAVVEFRAIVTQTVRFRTFQKADDVADGLALVWNEKHKWTAIAAKLSVPNKSAKYKLNSICYRRDRIVHNSDFDDALGDLSSCTMEDANEVVSYITKLVTAVDELVP